MCLLNRLPELADPEVEEDAEPVRGQLGAGRSQQLVPLHLR